MSWISLVAFKILCHCLWRADYNVSWCRSYCIHLAWSVLSFSDVLFMSSIKFGKFSTTVSSVILCVPFSHSSFSETPTTYMVIHLMVFQRSLRICFLGVFVLFFLFLKFNNFHFFIFKFAHSFLLAQICLWVPLVNFSF